LSPQRFKQSPKRLDRTEFITQFGAVYEHSPWIAEAVFEAGLDSHHDRIAHLHEAMRAVVEAAGLECQLALLRAHPDLASRLAMSDGLTPHSTGEQAGASLDKCSSEEFARFTALNDAYKAKFGFPFIMAVKGRNRGEILAAFERRAIHDAASEFRTALDEVHKIALFRLQAL
jgi:2-oxo-4-hydroxy-4-carboxy-5-ureidoimidazoline decarboxylase